MRNFTNPVAAFLMLAGFFFQHPAVAYDCNRFYQLLHSKEEIKAQMDKLEEHVEGLKTATDRHLADHFNPIVADLNQLKDRLDSRLKRIENDLESRKQEYQNTFGWTSRLTGGGGAKTFKREYIAPIEREIATIDDVLEFVEGIQEDLKEAIDENSRSQLVYDAKIVFALSYLEESSETATTFARELMGIKGDLKIQLSQLTDDLNKIRDHEDNFFDEEFEEGLAAISLRQDKPLTDSEIKSFFDLVKSVQDDFEESINEGSIVSLSLAIKKFPRGQQTEWVRAIEKAAEESSYHDVERLIPLANSVLAKSESIGKFTELANTAEKWVEEEWVYSESGVQLVNALYLKGDALTEANAKRVNAFFEKIYDKEFVGDEAEAAFVTSVLTILNGTETDLHRWEDLYNGFLEVDGVDNPDALNLASSVLIKEKIAQFPGEIPSFIAESSSSGGSSMPMVSLTNSMNVYNIVTGGGGDKNFLTPW